MPLPGIYRCDRIRQNNGIWEYFFARRNGENDEYVILNITIALIAIALVYGGGAAGNWMHALFVVVHGQNL